MTNEIKMQLPTGPLEYTLTNDFLFKAFLQRNEKALRGLLCALLDMKEEEITSIEIMNPIEEGSTIDDKTLILDIKLLLNTQQIINIEMQVADLGNWEERSLTYLCRMFDQLRTGEDYRRLKKTIHISILNYTPKGFPGKLYMDYYFYNRRWHHVYSDKLSIRMLQLNQLGNPEDEKENPELYYWAQFFRATTWEEIGMLAEKNESISEGIVTLRQLTEDEKIRMQCEAREDYRRNMVSATQLGEERGIQKGRLEGRQEVVKEIVQNMLRKGMSDEEIRTLTECEQELIDMVRKEMGN